MFDRLMERAQRLSRDKAEALRLELTERVGAELPRGVEAEAAPEGIRLSGRGLSRRFALDPALRWMIAGLK